MRVPARNPAAAQERYRHFMQQSLSCISDAVFYVAPRTKGEREKRALVCQPDPLELTSETGGRLYLSIGHNFRVVPDDRFAGEWKVRTEGYFYRVRYSEDASGELFAWHWHPEVRSEPHLHVARISGLHVPSGRVAFESIIRMLIDDLHVIPNRDDWQEVLAETEQRFQAFRTWPAPRVPPAPTT